MGSRITVLDVLDAKGRQPLVMLTAYDAATARWGEAAGADLLLVGDSLAMVVLGHDTTLAVTLDEMLHHARAVTRAASRSLVVGDLPFGSYQTGVPEAVQAGVRFIKESGVQAVKLEGRLPEHVRALVAAGIPVMGHLGLTPQSVHRMGGYLVQGRSVEDARDLLAAARDLEDAGCFALVLEGVPSEVASAVTAEVGVPTIGIGAGIDCDGQVLVIHDLLGITPEPRPRFVSAYAEIGQEAVAAASRWVADVRSRQIPRAEHSYFLSQTEAARWKQSRGGASKPDGQS